MPSSLFAWLIFMIMLICILIIIVSGLIMAIAPKLGVNPDKIKDGTTYEETIKRNRKSGIILLVLGIILLLFNL